MKLEPVKNYEKDRYPSLARYAATSSSKIRWSGRALVLAAAALAAILGGCLPSS